MASVNTQDMAVLPTQVVVSSESDPGTTYLVQLPYCPCKDFRYRRAALLADGAGVNLGTLFCKHLRKGLDLVGGWHRTEPAPLFFSGLTHTAVKELLVSSLVGLSPREANAVLAKVAQDGAGDFKASITGLKVDGTVTYDKLASRYTLLVTR
jgi:hypothetical protein